MDWSNGLLYCKDYICSFPDIHFLSKTPLFLKEMLVQSQIFCFALFGITATVLVSGCRKAEQTKCRCYRYMKNGQYVIRPVRILSVLPWENGRMGMMHNLDEQRTLGTIQYSHTGAWFCPGPAVSGWSTFLGALLYPRPAVSSQSEFLAACSSQLHNCKIPRHRRFWRDPTEWSSPDGLQKNQYLVYVGQALYKTRQRHSASWNWRDGCARNSPSRVQWAHQSIKPARFRIPSNQDLHAIG